MDSRVCCDIATKCTHSLYIIPQNGGTESEMYTNNLANILLDRLPQRNTQAQEHTKSAVRTI